MPPLQITYFTASLVVVLYTLVPEGRWRNTGKWVVTALVALTAVGRIALGAEAPTDVLVGVALGVTIPLVAFRLFAPSEIFRSAIGGAVARIWMSVGLGVRPSGAA
jgi:membrane-associated phospholipid phosphatase